MPKYNINNPLIVAQLLIKHYYRDFAEIALETHNSEEQVHEFAHLLLEKQAENREQRLKEDAINYLNKLEQ